MRDRVELVDKKHPEISMRKQCDLLGVARSTVTYKPVEEDPEDIRIKRLLDEVYMIDPCLGSRRLVTVLARDYDIRTDRKRVARLRRDMGQETIWCKPRTSIPDDGHRKYPFRKSSSATLAAWPTKSAGQAGMKQVGATVVFMAVRTACWQCGGLTSRWRSGFEWSVGGAL